VEIVFDSENDEILHVTRGRQLLIPATVAGLAKTFILTGIAPLFIPLEISHATLLRFRGS
jgi:hypothetical protein